jgi:vacuolar-type H+-ATPase subunit H
MAMEDVLKKIIELEYKAQQIKNEAIEEKKRLFEEAEAEIAKMKEEIFLSVKNQIEDMKKIEQDNIKKESEKLMLDTERKIGLMWEEFNKNKDLWVKEIFNKVVSIGED